MDVGYPYRVDEDFSAEFERDLEKVVTENLSSNDDDRWVTTVSGEVVAFDENGDRVIFTHDFKVPDEVAQEFDLATLEDCGVVKNGHYQMTVKADDENQISFVRQHEARSYPGRFETAMFEHFSAEIQEAVDEASRKETYDTAEPATRVLAVEYLGDRQLDALPSAFGRNEDSRVEAYRVEIDDQKIEVAARIEEGIRVVDVSTDHDDQIGVEVLDSNRDRVIAAVQRDWDAVLGALLEANGWSINGALGAGYVVLPAGEIERVEARVASEGANPKGERCETASGRGVYLHFSDNGKLEKAFPEGAPVTLRPVAEGSREHFVEAKAELSDHDITLAKSNVGYRVDYRKGSRGHMSGKEGSAYYTDDLADAVETGRDMAVHRDASRTNARNHWSHEEILKELSAAAYSVQS